MKGLLLKDMLLLKNNKKLSRKSLRDSIIRYKTTDR